MRPSKVTSAANVTHTTAEQRAKWVEGENGKHEDADKEPSAIQHGCCGLGAGLHFLDIWVVKKKWMKLIVSNHLDL